MLDITLRDESMADYKLATLHALRIAHCSEKKIGDFIFNKNRLSKSIHELSFSNISWEQMGLLIFCKIFDKKQYYLQNGIKNKI